MLIWFCTTQHFKHFVRQECIFTPHETFLQTGEFDAFDSAKLISL